MEFYYTKMSLTDIITKILDCHLPIFCLPDPSLRPLTKFISQGIAH